MTRPPALRFLRRPAWGVGVLALTLLLLRLVGGLGPAPAAGDEEVAVADLPRDAVLELLRTRPCTPALTDALRARRGIHILGEWALRDAEGFEILNAADHLVALGWMSPRCWRTLERAVDFEVCFEGVVRRITHPGLHAWYVVVDVREVFGGSLTLTPERTPLVIGVRASGGDLERRWIGNTWEAGTRLTFCASEGELLIELPARLVRCVTAWGGFVWETSGREREVWPRLAPLACRDPAAILEGLGAEDATRRWLFAVRALATCRTLGEPFASWFAHDLARERLLPLHDEVVAAFGEIADRLVWDAKARVFRRSGDLPDDENR